MPACNVPKKSLMSRQPLHLERNVRDERMGSDAVETIRPAEHLLVATNFSERSGRAIERAVRCSEALGAQVTILHVVEPNVPKQILRQRRREASAALATCVRALSSGVRAVVSEKVRVGAPSLEIVREAIEAGSDTIVLGFDGHGKTIADVVRYSDKPVLLVSHAPAGPYRRSVVDVSVTHRTVCAALRLAPGAESHFVFVGDRLSIHGPSTKRTTVPWQRLGQVMRRYRTRRPNALLMPLSLDQAFGNPTLALLDSVSRVAADLLVVHSDGAFQEIGVNGTNLAGALLTVAPCDLLLVHGNDLHVPAPANDRDTRCPSVEVCWGAPSFPALEPSTRGESR